MLGCSRRGFYFCQINISGNFRHAHFGKSVHFVIFGPYWGLIWSLLGLIWSLLSLIWSLLGLIWSLLGPIWSLLGLIWSLLGPIWPYWALFGHIGPYLALTVNQKRNTEGPGRGHRRNGSERLFTSSKDATAVSRNRKRIFYSFCVVLQRSLGVFVVLPVFYCFSCRASQPGGIIF